MRKVWQLLCLLVFLAVTGCAGRTTIVVRGDPDRVGEAQDLFVVGKECFSLALDIRILIHPPFRSSEEIWTRQEVRIEITARDVEPYGIFSPVLVVIEHVLDDAAVKAKFERSFTDDFPTFMTGDLVSTIPKFERGRHERTLREFLNRVTASQSLTYEALRDILSNYSGLLDSCLY